MAPRARIPDAFYHASLWLGAGLALILFGCGFAARAGDASPWRFWIGAPAAMLPFALLVWLRDSGKVEFIDTEAVEERRYAVHLRVPVYGGWRLAFFLVATIAGFVWEEYAEDSAIDRLTDAALSIHHPLRVAWALIAVGIVGAVYETIVVVRDAARTPEEPTPPGTEGRPEE